MPVTLNDDEFLTLYKAYSVHYETELDLSIQEIDQDTFNDLVDLENASWEILKKHYDLNYSE